MDAFDWPMLLLALLAGGLLGCWLRARRRMTQQRALARQLATLNTVATVVGRSLELDEILTSALEATLEVMAVEAGGIYLLDVPDGVLTLAAHRGLSAEFVADIDRLQTGEGFSGWVVQSGESLVIGDIARDPRLTREVLRRAGLRSLIVAPLRSKAEMLGTLFVITRETHAFADQESQLLESIAQQVGLAIANARLFATVTRRAEQFRVVTEVGRQITSTLDIEPALMQLVQLIRDTFQVYHVAIGLIEGDEVVYHFGAGELWDDPAFDFRPGRLKVGSEGLTGWVAASGEPVLAADVSREPRYVWMEGSVTRSELVVPIRSKGEILGVLDLQSDRLNAFDASDLATMQSLADQAAVAIQNAGLYTQAQQAAVLEERQRLARELHDALTQTLFSASLIADVLPRVWVQDPEKGQQQLDEVRLLTRGALAEMRTLLLELRPKALAEARMEDLLGQLGRALTGRTGIPVTLDVREPVKLPVAVQAALYRIAQEAQNNIARHAQATRVAVCYHAEQGRAHLSIGDDGCGFDVDCVGRDHFGLQNMRERAAAIGGSLHIVSRPGAGTQIIVEWREGQRDGS